MNGEEIRPLADGEFGLQINAWRKRHSKQIAMLHALCTI